MSLRIDLLCQHSRNGIDEVIDEVSQLELYEKSRYEVNPFQSEN